MKKAVIQALIVLLIAIAPAIATGLWHPNRPDWSEPIAGPGQVLLETARDKNNAAWRHTIWIDTRPFEEYRIRTAPDAINLRMDTWDKLIVMVRQARQFSDTKFVVFGEDDNDPNAKSVAERLRKEEPQLDVYTLVRGWKAWEKVIR
jgi:Rhodanese-like domain